MDGFVTMICPRRGCQRVHLLNKKLRGQEVQCLHCRKRFRVPFNRKTIRQRLGVHLRYIVLVSSYSLRLPDSVHDKLYLAERRANEIPYSFDPVQIIAMPRGLPDRQDCVWYRCKKKRSKQ